MFVHSRKCLLGVLAVFTFALVQLMHLSPAYAQACSDSSYSYNSSCAGNAASAGSTVTSSSTVTVSANQTANLVLDRISSIRVGGAAPGAQANGGDTINLFDLGSGRSAANGMKSLGVWGNAAISHFDGDKSGAKFDGEAYSIMLGADFMATDRLLIGVSAGYEIQDVDTKFNTGELDGTGITVAPYFGLKIDDTFSVDGMIGYSILDYDLERTDPLSSAKVTGSHDADRIFGSLNLNGNWTQDKINYSARIGTLYIDEDQDAFTESDGTAVGKTSITVGTVSVGGRVGYQLKMAEPYVSATGGYDYDGAGGTYDGKTSFGGAVGVQFNAGNGVTGNIEGSGSYKDDVTAYGGSFFLRYGLKF